MVAPSNIARRTPARAGNAFVAGAYASPDLSRTGERARSLSCPENLPRHTYGSSMPTHADLEPHEELHAVPALAELPRETLAELAASAVQRRVLSGVTLVEQGATATHLDVLARGAVKVARLTRHALGESTVVLEVARAPAILLGTSLFDGQPEAASVVTLRSSQVLQLDRRMVLRLAGQHPAFGRALLAHMAQSVRRHVRRIDEVASGPVDDRVRHLLEGLAHEHGTPFGQGRFIAIPLRRRDIACMVNATTETVSRVLARFEREGLTRSTRDGIWLRVQTASVRPAPRDDDSSDAHASGSRGVR
ncbi:MAG TPA: Crp/Fnr family transcriptional regulator [Polyangiaceae bacterium]|jgi:CRP-like cAMP-binding protein